MILKTSAILTSVSMSHDHGLRLSFHTNEMTTQEKQSAIELHDSYGYLLFKSNEIKESDIPTEEIEDKSKTPSKRLRAVLYILHIQSGGEKLNFETFYRDRMERLIEQIKAKLD